MSKALTVTLDGIKYRCHLDTRGNVVVWRGETEILPITELYDDICRLYREDSYYAHSFRL